MIVYLDTSIVLRALLGQGTRLKKWGEWQAAYSSELLGLEARRVIDRLRLDLPWTTVACRRPSKPCWKLKKASVLLSRLVLDRASLPMPTVVKTLDAIHLTSALLFQERRGEKCVFATHKTSHRCSSPGL